MKTLCILAVTMAAIALAVALWKDTSLSAEAQVVPGGDADGLGAQLRRLQREVTALKASQDRVLEQTAQRHAAVPRADFPSVETLEEQVANLAVQQSKLDQWTRSMDPLGVIEATEREISDAYVTLLDTSREPWERAKRAETLKRYGQFDDQAVQAMIQLFNSAEDLNQKAAALVALRGYVTPEICDDILAAFSADVDEGFQSGRLRYHSSTPLDIQTPRSIKHLVLRG